MPQTAPMKPSLLKYETSTKTIQQLLASNRRLEARVADLERPKAKSTPFTFQPPTIRTTVIPNTPLVSQADFLPVETTPKPLPATWAAKTSAHRPRQKATTPARTIAAKARLFQEPSGPQGYEYVYLPRSRRMTRPEARSSSGNWGSIPLASSTSSSPPVPPLASYCMSSTRLQFWNS